MSIENGKHSLEESSMQLLSKPDQEEDASFKKDFKRGSCSYEDRCERFRVKERRYSQQYASLYFVRLTKMREMVKEAAAKKWGKVKAILQRVL